jgi:hypothetical protein
VWPPADLHRARDLGRFPGPFGAPMSVLEKRLEAPEAKKTANATAGEPVQE